MISFQIKKILLASCVLISPVKLVGAPNIDSLKPVFIGKTKKIFVEDALMMSAPINKSFSSYSYMTAPEMQSTIVSLTGFYHPAFDAYADVIGRYDAQTGLRTNDRPSLVSVLFMQKISASIADAVIEREIFLDDDEKIVFPKIDLTSSPNDTDIESFINDLHTRWLGLAPSQATMGRLIDGYRGIEKSKNSTDAYKWLLAMLLRHGGLYYY